MRGEKLRGIFHFGPIGPKKEKNRDAQKKPGSKCQYGIQIWDFKKIRIFESTRSKLKSIGKNSKPSLEDGLVSPAA